jgi:hypothetical protein
MKKEFIKLPSKVTRHCLFFTLISFCEGGFLRQNSSCIKSLPIALKQKINGDRCETPFQWKHSAQARKCFERRSLVIIGDSRMMQLGVSFRR